MMEDEKQAPRGSVGSRARSAHPRVPSRRARSATGMYGPQIHIGPFQWEEFAVWGAPPVSTARVVASRRLTDAFAKYSASSVKLSTRERP
jgi:hypothetical protein